MISVREITDDESSEETLIRLLKFGVIKKIRDFLLNGTTVNLHYPTQKLATPLTTAIDRGDPQILITLLERVPTDIDGTTTQACGKTALMHAAYVTRNTDILEVLLKRGADLRKTDVRGWNCLYHAIAGEKIQNVACILDYGVSVDSSDSEGRTPLMISVFLSNLDILKLLLDRGADIEAVDNAGLTALQLAVLRRKRDATMTLIDRGCNVHRISKGSKFSAYELAGRIMPNIVSIL